MKAEKLFENHFDKYRNGILRSSLDHYLETGKLSGSLLLESRAMFRAWDNAWVFLSTGINPTEEGEYECLDRYGNIDKHLWANSGAPNEPTSFFNGKIIKSMDIIAWRTI